jgi:hypothetical protein
MSGILHVRRCSIRNLRFPIPDQPQPDLIRKVAAIDLDQTPKQQQAGKTKAIKVV